MQLSEMEEEMDQRIHAAERKTREKVNKLPHIHAHINTPHASMWNPENENRAINITYVHVLLFLEFLWANW